MKKFGKFLAAAAAVAAGAAAAIYYFEKKKEQDLTEDDFDDFDDFDDDLDDEPAEEPVTREYVSLHKTAAGSQEQSREEPTAPDDTVITEGDSTPAKDEAQEEVLVNDEPSADTVVEETI